MNLWFINLSWVLRLGRTENLLRVCPRNNVRVCQSRDESQKYEKFAGGPVNARFKCVGEPTNSSEGL